MKKTVSILLFFLCYGAAIVAQNLQEFTVVSFEEKPFDMSAKDGRYKIVDGNGELFSIIKLVPATPDDNLRAYSFDFGLCESRVKSVDGDVWVYVQRNAMRVTIKREGYRILKNYELNTTVQPGRVYEMVLSAEPGVVKKRHLLFKVQPADSKALVLYKAENEHDYRPFGKGQVSDEGLLSDKVVVGRYCYRVSSQNYHLSEGFVDLVDEAGTFIEEITLRSNLATIVLTADKDTEIFIDGESMGFGSWKGKLPPGPYSVECRKENHANTVESIVVRAGETMEIALKLPVPITGTLDIVSEPLDATITIDGKDYGKTPAEITGLAIGGREIAVSKAGYKTENVVVNIKEGKIVEQYVKLTKLQEKIKESNKPVQTAKTVKNNKKIESNAFQKQTSSVVNMENGHEYVDLGLSVKWATCNVGASKPEEHGGYYAWGETEEKKVYSWNTYKWCTGDNNKVVKYGNWVDNKIQLEPADDVAYVKWGGTWRMPTNAEFDELSDRCTWVRITQNGVVGYKVTGPNGNSIFLPAVGYRNDDELYYCGYCSYWSGMRSVFTGSVSDWMSYNFFVGGEARGTGSIYRYYGYTVRPVCDFASTSIGRGNMGASPVSGVTLDKTGVALTKGGTVSLAATVTPSYAADKNVVWNTTDASVATVNNGVVAAVANGTATITATAAGFVATCKVTVVDYITVLDDLSNGTVYYISQPYHSKGATSWAVASGGNALKSNKDLNIASDMNDVRQQFSIVSHDGGKTRFLYHPAEAKYICKNGTLNPVPVDAIKIKRGARDGTFMFYFDSIHYINVGGKRELLIDNWYTPDGGNSCTLSPVSK